MTEVRELLFDDFTLYRDSLRMSHGTTCRIVSRHARLRPREP